MPFPHVFDPLQLRHRTLTSRINFGAHTANMAEGGLPGERHIGYYRERALGGAGMIVVEPVPVHRTAVLTRGNFRHGDDAVVPAFRRLTDACRDANPDVVMIQQLYHVGQHGDADNSFAPNWSPSGLPSYHDADGSHAMTEAEIEEVIDGFVSSARRAQAAGFDGVEIFAAYHALVDQFWTPWSNRRDDGWGGDFERRMRFSATVLERIRDVCGDDFIIGLAVSMDERSAPALSMAELAEIVAWHDQRELMDYVTCGTGSYFDFYPIIPVSLFEQQLGVPFAAELKRVVTHARVQAESHIRTPEAAEAVLAAGQADMVSIVRGQIADPHLVAKARADRADEVRPCISCNQMCWGRRSRDYWISCLVNPSAGREFQWDGDRFEPAATSRSVLVVGGGPAGLEAARVAAERGHHVTLLERGEELGGQFRLAGLQPSRDQIRDLIEWYGRRLAALGVEVRLGTTATAAEVAAAGADEVVVATGARPPRTGFQRALPMVDRLPGAERPDVVAIHDVLDGEREHRRPRGRPGRPWRLARARDGGPPDRGRPRGHGRHRRPGRRWRPLPQRRRRAAADTVDGGRRRDAPQYGPAGLGRVRRRDPIDTDRRSRASCSGHPRHRRDARRRDGARNGADRPGHCFRGIGDCVAPRRASLAFYEGREAGRRL